jgi:hypothetical protein
MFARVVRSPFFVFSFLLGALLVTFVLAWVSVGDWCEGVLRWLGYRGSPYWLPAAAGLMAYVGLGIIGPAYLGAFLVSWPGLLAGPLCVLVLIALADRW